MLATRPDLDTTSIVRTFDGIKACPLPDVIDLKTLQVNFKTCQRCLLCYQACPENAISVKDYSVIRGLS